jgi:hypothetical protein
MQRIGMIGLDRKRLSAAELRIKDASGPKMLLAQFAECCGSSSGGATVVRSRLWILAGGAAFATVHRRFRIWLSAQN